MAKEKIKLNQDVLFNKLNDSILRLNKEQSLVFYLINIGPVKFQIAIPLKSSFQKSINSFYNAQIIEEISSLFPTVYCLDECYTEKLPSLSFSKNELNLNSFFSRLSNKKVIINFDESRNLLKVFNPPDQNHLFFCKSFETLPSWEIYSPLKEFIHFIALANNCWLSHAGSLSKGNEAILLFGPGGNGKSTTTLAGLIGGFQTLGDDYVLLEDLNGEFNVHAIYRTIKSFPSSILKLPKTWNKLERHTIEHNGKYVYFCSEGEDANLFKSSAKVLMSFGLYLQKDLSTNDDIDFNARYLSLSSIEQIPFWIDKSSKFSEKLFKHVPHMFLHSKKGIATLEKNIMIINKYFKNIGIE